jgi:hypothetical protein
MLEDILRIYYEFAFVVNLIPIYWYCHKVLRLEACFKID